MKIRLPLWEEIALFNKELVISHPKPQIWASYLALYTLAKKGGLVIILVGGYEKEAFFRATFKWLSLIGVETFLTKETFSFGDWGKLLITYPFHIECTIKEAQACLIVSPYLFKKNYYFFLKKNLKKEAFLWVFNSYSYPKKKGKRSILNKPYNQRLLWHFHIFEYFIRKRDSKSFDSWSLITQWELRIRKELLKKLI